jgi:serine phosphatase RsbU (regulator of sigma subunit)
MTDVATLFQNPTLVKRNRELATRVLEYLQEGSYCALLGPRYSGKSEVVHVIEALLAEHWGRPCVHIDLYELEVSTQRGFFAGLATLIAQQVAELTQCEIVGLEVAEASSAAFRGFVLDAVATTGGDVVLILDHLEALPNDLVQALLTSLRAAYMDQQTLDYRLMVVVSGALSLAAVTVGESSPFRGIARRVFVNSLTEGESEAFIAEQIESNWMQPTEDARHTLFHAARGDPNLLWRIYRDAVDLARRDGAETLDAMWVEQIAEQFLSDQVSYYAPLQEAVRAIEQDPDLLRCVLLLLEREQVPMAELPLPLSPDLDPLRLTGVVEKVGDVAGGHYRLRNGIYRRFLAQHLHPGRVGYLLTMSGRWDSAIDYLEASVSAGNEQYRWDLLTAIINSMYASDNVSRAAHFLLRGLTAAFDIAEAQVWYAPLQEPSLRLVACIGPEGPDAPRIGMSIHISEDRLETRCYREGVSLRGPETGRCVERALPLLTAGRRPVAVLMLVDCLGGSRFSEQRERELQLAGYLNQAARALEQVARRTQELVLAGRVQASLLPRTPSLPGWELSAVLRPARQTAGDFFDFIQLPAGRLGIVIADVADKGMGAALYMALTRTLIRTFAADYPFQPERVLRAASARVLSDAGAGLFVTVFYGILDPASGRLVYCTAGHHPPYLIAAPGRAPASEPRMLPPTGMALGVVDGATWQQQSAQVERGDLLLLYTDGVVEAQDREGQLFGFDRLLAVARRQPVGPIQDMQDAILAAVSDHARAEVQSDDISLVLVRRELQGGERERGEPGRHMVEPPPGRRPGTIVL